MKMITELEYKKALETIELYKRQIDIEVFIAKNSKNGQSELFFQELKEGDVIEIVGPMDGLRQNSTIFLPGSRHTVLYADLSLNFRTRSKYLEGYDKIKNLGYNHISDLLRTIGFYQTQRLFIENGIEFGYVLCVKTHGRKGDTRLRSWNYRYKLVNP